MASGFWRWGQALFRRAHWVAATGALSVVAAFSAFFHPVIVRGTSMAPTLKSGQVLLMERCSAAPWGFPWIRSGIRPGDIVLFRHRGETYIKRVHATGGEVVRLASFRGGGSFLVETVGPPERIARFFVAHPDLGRIRTVRVPAGMLFVVGDNPSTSLDSRDFGPVPASAVVGRIWRPAPPVPEGWPAGSPRHIASADVHPAEHGTAAQRQPGYN